jgi:hypothetical protein
VYHVYAYAISPQAGIAFRGIETTLGRFPGLLVYCAGYFVEFVTFKEGAVL